MTFLEKSKMEKKFCNYCQIGDCKNCLGLNFAIYCNHDCNYLKKQKLGYKESQLFV